MKKKVFAIGIVGLLSLATLAFAHGPGWWGGGMMGGGFGPGYCQGPAGGYGPGYMRGFGPGACGGPYGVDQKFFEETKDLRKQLHEKRFEYFETLRDPNADREKVAKLEKEIEELQEKIYEKSPRRGFRGGFYGGMNGGGWNCPGPGGWR
ncbi:MAG: hypothetical protein D6726_06555 [Nitrospirae bacterium]|nr:MAG: hypothetical protein D6726_06555 [Nitrospirota bacterium]